MCRSMVEIQSVAAEIRRGKKEDDRKIEITGQKYNAPLLHRAAIIIFRVLQCVLRCVLCCPVVVCGFQIYPHRLASGQEAVR